MSSAAKSGIHPLVAIASVAVLVLAGVGVAAFTGVLPGTSGSTDKGALSSAPAAEPAKAVTPKTADVRPAQPKVAAPKPARPAPVPVAVMKCTVCGVVEAVQEVEVKGEATGAGAVAGGVAGAVVGNQVGSGSKKKVARIIGAVGGAVVGHQVEKSARSTKRYDITVRMEDGTLRTLSQEQAPTWRTGDKVRVVNDALEAG
jgi:outer membrane lipoprotein SlyB